MHTQSVTVGAGTDFPLKGILTLPETTEPVPAVVLVQGSGSSNMDEKVGKLTPFKDLAEGLARHGIAALRYDKRSFAHPFKLLFGKHGPITMKEEVVDDALLATELLRAHPRVDPNRVFLLGHSMGAMLAPRIDAEGGHYAGLILMAGTLRKLEDVMLEQNEEVRKELRGLPRLLVEKQVQKLRRQFDGLYALSDEQAKAVKLGNGVTLYYFKEAGKYPTGQYLTQLEKPILILQGEQDVQVKADLDFALYQTTLAGKPNVSFRLYEGLNHAFVPALHNSLLKTKQEFGTERHIGPEVIGDIADWVQNAGT